MAVGNKGSENIRQRMVTEYEYMVNLSPSKLARYLRTRLAQNQGCPPTNLMTVFTLCRDSASCDDCWWMWLNSEHRIERQPADKYAGRNRCWDCRWGAKGENAHPFVACMHRKFYGAIMDADDYCCFFDELKPAELCAEDKAIVEEFGEITPSNAEAVGAELRRRFELKALGREMERRRREKNITGGDNTADERKESEGT